MNINTHHTKKVFKEIQMIILGNKQSKYILKALSC